MADDMLEKLITELMRALAPVVQAVAEEPVGAGVQRLALEVGYDLGDAVTDERASEFAAAVTEAYGALRNIVADSEGFVEHFPEAAGRITRLVEALEGLDEWIGPEADLGARLLDYLIVTYLAERTPTLHALLRLLGVVEEAPVSAEGTAASKVRPVVNWSALSNIFEPARLFEQRYGWGTLTLDSDELLSRLADVLWSVEVPASYDSGAAAGEGVLDAGWTFGSDAGSYFFGLRAARADVDGGRLPGLALIPAGTASLNYKAQLGAGWGLTLGLRAGASSGYQLTLRPGGDVRLAATPAGPAVNWALGAQLELSQSAGPNLRTTLFGSPRSALLMARTAALRGGAEATPEGGDIELALVVEDGLLVVSTEDSDSFLRAVLPRDGLTAEVSFAVEWSSRTGLHFVGSGSLETAIPLQLSAGPVRVDSAYIALGVSEEAQLHATAAATAGAELGPVGAVVDRLGVDLIIALQPPFGVELRFKPPTGIALSIDAGGVTGGGFIFFEAESEQYAGALHLEIGELTLNAIGLLTTRLPDGTPGFSLLVIIQASGFTPVQLGFGFTLNGVGGLVGINRTVAIDVLRAGVRTRALDAILFSQDDPTPRAPQIISALQSVFPPAPGRYVFGPMVLVGWGTPTVLTIELALVLELLAPVRLMMLGRLRAALPKPDAAVVRLNLDAFGVIDFEKREISIDASLYDSTVGPFTISGDMALRAGWGEQPTFILSIGGFHPAYAPPPGLPALRRLAIALSSGNNPRLRAEAYLAITSNTVQIGAGLEFYVAALGFSLEGGFAFDALLQLSPFRFQVDIYARLALKKGRRTLLGLDITVHLDGPNPWHVKGKAKFKVLFISVSIDFEGSFGGRAELPPRARADIWALLEPELKNTRNWTAELPPDSGRIASLRTTGDAALVHPLGSASVTQRTVPLSRNVTRFGDALPLSAHRFEIESASGLSLGEDTYDHFAPAQFFEMSDAEKLSRPSFDRMPSGRRVSGDNVRYGDVKYTPLAYETIVVDEDERPPAPPQQPYAPSPAVLASLAEVGPAANADVRSTGHARFRPTGQPDIEVRDERFVVTQADALVAVDAQEPDSSYTGALEALLMKTRDDPARADELQIVRAHELAIA